MRSSKPPANQSGSIPPEKQNEILVQAQVRLRNREPTLPGDILKHEFMDPLSLSARALASLTGLPIGDIDKLVNSQRAITARIALRLSEALDTSPDFWMHLQASCDLWKESSRPTSRPASVSAIPVAVKFDLTKQTLAEYTPFERFHSHRMGWSDGASGRAMRREFETNPSPLGILYREQYDRAKRVRSGELTSASQQYGYVPNILRDSNVE